MKTLFLEEARLLLPFWVAAVVLAVAPVWLTGFRSDPFGTALFWFGGGVVLLSVIPFGLEFSNGTFPLLLTQPVSRRRIWLVKVFVLTVALFGVLGCFWLSLRCRVLGTRYEPFLADFLDISGMVVLVGLAGGLWTTLLLRQIAAAIWFTPLVPGVLTLLALNLPAEASTEWRLVPTVVVLIVYAALGILWAAWLFARAQDAQWTGGTVSLSFLRLWPVQLQTSALTKPRARWLALLAKELHLHQISLLLAGGAAVFHVAVILIRALVGRPVSARTYETLKYLDLSVWFLWFVVPAMLGAMAVAEERKLGTLEGQLCRPMSRRTQFIFKFASVLLLSVSFAALLPWVLEQFRLLIGVHSEVDLSKKAWQALLELMASVFVTAAVFFFASTMARNALQGLGIAAVLGVAGIFVAGVAASSKSLSYYLGVPLWEGPLINYVAWPVMIATAFGLAYANFRRLHEGRRTWSRNVLMLTGALFASGAVTSLAYYRAWELVMPLEPKHGPARISQQGRTKLCVAAAAEKHFVLLPDGRLWASPDFLIEEWMGFRHWESARFPRRSAHGFLPGSNWVDVATTIREAAAIQADGSLWSVFRYQPRSTPELKLSRIGPDTNWIKLASGSGHFLAVKNDGTLWGWGNNRDGQLASDLPKTYEAPVRLGKDSDWAGCFARHSLSFGVKRDGGLWMWGRYYSQKAGAWPTERARLSLPGDGIKDIVHSSCVLYEDGRLWTVSASGDELGHAEPDDSNVADNQWLAVSWNGPHFIGLKPDGTLWKLTLTWAASKNGRGSGRWRLDPLHTVQVSQYPDWVAMCEEFGSLRALAADGTLCAWWQYRERTAWLRLTRLPLGCVNIFDSGTISQQPPRAR